MAIVPLLFCTDNGLAVGRASRRHLLSILKMSSQRDRPWNSRLNLFFTGITLYSHPYGGALLNEDRMWVDGEMYRRKPLRCQGVILIIFQQFFKRDTVTDSFKRGRENGWAETGWKYYSAVVLIKEIVFYKKNCSRSLWIVHIPEGLFTLTA